MNWQDDDRAWRPGWKAGALEVIEDRGCRKVECRCLECGGVAVYSRISLEKSNRCNRCRLAALGERQRKLHEEQKRCK